jgi:hypothetical protein
VRVNAERHGHVGVLGVLRDRGRVVADRHARADVRLAQPVPCQALGQRREPSLFEGLSASPGPGSHAVSGHTWASIRTSGNLFEHDTCRASIAGTSRVPKFGSTMIALPRSPTVC